LLQHLASDVKLAVPTSVEAVMNVTVRKIGNSEGVILPKEVLDRHNLKAGDTLVVSETKESISLTPAEDTFERQMHAAREIMDRYRVALQKLAE
jgi:putative addiction module antidote